jgi:hypothetical protein
VISEIVVSYLAGLIASAHPTNKAPIRPKNLISKLPPPTLSKFPGAL